MQYLKQEVILGRWRIGERKNFPAKQVVMAKFLDKLGNVEQMFNVLQLYIKDYAKQCNCCLFSVTFSFALMFHQHR